MKDSPLNVSKFLLKNKATSLLIVSLVAVLRVLWVSPFRYTILEKDLKVRLISYKAPRTQHVNKHNTYQVLYSWALPTAQKFLYWNTSQSYLSKILKIICFVQYLIYPAESIACTCAKTKISPQRLKNNHMNCMHVCACTHICAGAHSS